MIDHSSGEPSSAVAIRATVNGEAVEASVDARRLLVDFLRDDLRLTGTHNGCEHGVCGACTVLVDGISSRSCLIFAAQVDGCDIRTVESLESADGLSPMQTAFADCHALQCGFCTPGFLMTLAGEDPNDWPTESSIRSLISGNLCRCTGYEPIVRAVSTVWSRARRAGTERAERGEGAA